MLYKLQSLRSTLVIVTFQLTKSVATSFFHRDTNSSESKFYFHLIIFLYLQLMQMF